MIELIDKLLKNVRNRILLLIVGMALALIFFLQVYPREHLGYNPMLDPEQQLATALERAKAEQKDILFIGGGDWCSWCWHLKEMLDDDPKLDEELHQAFVVEKIFWRQPSVNQAFINQFQEMHFAPFLMLLDENKKVLMAKPAGDFLVEKKGEGYSPKRLRQFIQYWQQQKAKRIAMALGEQK